MSCLRDVAPLPVYHPVRLRLHPRRIMQHRNTLPTAPLSVPAQPLNDALRPYWPGPQRGNRKCTPMTGNRIFMHVFLALSFTLISSNLSVI